jgi:hypothetical protein
LAAISLKAVLRTAQWESRDKQYYHETLARNGSLILAFWHECLGLAAWEHKYYPGAHTLTSYSFDGELAARTVSHFGYKSLRGSSSHGSVGALKQLEAVAKEGCSLGWTLDGPRGPRRRAKAGVAWVAARTGMPILPNAFAIRGCKRVHSWDRFPIPYPFAQVLCAFGPPIPPPVDTTARAIEATRSAVEAALNRLHEGLESELGVAIG